MLDKISITDPSSSMKNNGGKTAKLRSFENFKNNSKKMYNNNTANVSESATPAVSENVAQPVEQQANINAAVTPVPSNNVQSNTINIEDLKNRLSSKSVTECYDESVISDNKFTGARKLRVGEPVKNNLAATTKLVAIPFGSSEPEVSEEPTEETEVEMTNEIEENTETQEMASEVEVETETEVEMEEPSMETEVTSEEATEEYTNEEVPIQQFDLSNQNLAFNNTLATDTSDLKLEQYLNNGTTDLPSVPVEMTGLEQKINLYELTKSKLYDLSDEIRSKEEENRLIKAEIARYEEMLNRSIQAVQEEVDSKTEDLSNVVLQIRENRELLEKLKNNLLAQQQNMASNDFTDYGMNR